MSAASQTTLAIIEAAGPRQSMWEDLLAALGKGSADNDPLEFLDILNATSFGDVVWVMTFAAPDDRPARRFQSWIVNRVLNVFEDVIPDDPRIRALVSSLLNDTLTRAEIRDLREAVRDVLPRVRLRRLRPALEVVRAVSTDSLTDAVEAAVLAAIRKATLDEALRLAPPPGPDPEPLLEGEPPPDPNLRLVLSDITPAQVIAIRAVRDATRANVLAALENRLRVALTNLAAG